MAKTVYSVDSRTAGLWFGIAKSNFPSGALLWQAHARITAFTKCKRKSCSSFSYERILLESVALFAPPRIPASCNESANFVVLRQRKMTELSYKSLSLSAIKKNVSAGKTKILLSSRLLRNASLIIRFLSSLKLSSFSKIYIFMARNILRNLIYIDLIFCFYKINFWRKYCSVYFHRKRKH